MTGGAAPLSLALAPHVLTLHWSDGESAVSAAVLRASCRCAPCQSARLRGEPVSTALPPTLVDALTIGHYAVQLHFSDGHDRGIYPWAYLRELSGDVAAGAGA